MYLNLSNFQGKTSAGGDKPWSKNGDKCRLGGGLAKFSPDGGTPSPPGKNPELFLIIRKSLKKKIVKYYKCPKFELVRG